MRIVADTGRCIGAAVCALAVPEVFDQDPVEATVVVLDPAPPPETHEAVREAVERCPSGALRVDGSTVSART
ncbi:ferredoxin [Streptomyces sp. NPDC044780]|uniref:Ferredoxin n=1 Tax=Streptomyces luomodiensis TaxID=3026192 RepID=A0ABY9V8I8_9ACTN|nr:MULTISPECIES: ferredoxin [Streptomyces]MDN3056133.1 ferredoxin [Streptomyces sp. SRF1]WAP60539.1 ferredoxin [Streptomyces sp. S465]WNF01225.1 ferredoxin [Streptomyces sp. SCA4-21]